MKPTRIHYFYAQDWPMKIWFSLVPLVFLVVAIKSCDLSIAALKDFASVLWILAICIISLLLGFFAATLFGWPILGPAYYARELKNGGPFKVGDTVQILTKPHRGRVVRVYSLWQGNTVRVELDDEAKKAFKDIFSPTKLVREPDATPRADSTSGNNSLMPPG